ncbi:MAG: hypothetical protein R2706_16775 [Acidimicrobiales bacterium]
MTEAQAKAEGIDMASFRSIALRPTETPVVGETDGLVKVIAKKNADGSAGTILGVHMVGHG